MKPRYRFCWWCGRKLRGPYGREVTFESGQVARVHGECATKIDKEYSVVSVTCIDGCPCRKHAARPQEPK